MLLDSASKEKFKAYFADEGYTVEEVKDIVETFLDNTVRVTQEAPLPLTYLGVNGSYTFKSYQPVTVETSDGNEFNLPSFMALGVNEPSIWENLGNTNADVKDIIADFFASKQFTQEEFEGNKL